MSEDSKNSNGGAYGLGAVIKLSMAERSVSLRQLSKLTGIGAASISRIINNKQRANLGHLLKFSEHLNIPIEQLLSAIGIGGEGTGNINGDHFLIQELLKSFDIDLRSLIDDIQKELKKYEQYAKTAEGKKIILNEYMSKIGEVNGSGIIIEHLQTLYRLFCSKDVEADEQAIIGSALLYFILSADVIPDYTFPIGYLDDAIAVNIVASRLPQYFIT